MENKINPKGTLYLIPSFLADESKSKALVQFNAEILKNINEYIVENSKAARKFIKDCELGIVQANLLLHELEKQSNKDLISKMLTSLDKGKDMGLMSDAGCPGIADPGALVVEMAHKKGIKVVPLVGPSSIILALMASGFNGQSFTFHGYLPISKADKQKKLRELERLSEKSNQTQLFIETPFRNLGMYEDLLKSLANTTFLSIAVNLTGKDEEIITLNIANWKKRAAPDIQKKPAVFSIYAPSAK